jgi:hypothetical protein
MNDHARRPWLSAVGLSVVAWLVGCAHKAPAEQTIEVRVEADSPSWTGPLACQASNSAGSWLFTAPGAVTVLPSTSPLQITRQALAGSAAQPSVTSPSSPSKRERAREGASTGAKVGAGAGVALGVAAAPVMGGAFAVLIAAGAAMKGGAIGGLVGSVRSGEKYHYPSPVVLHVKSEPPGSSP